MAPAKKGTAAKSMPKQGKDPKGGLTAAGRAFFKAKEGANLRPGVQGPADTPEKMVRKGSFLRRHYANPPGPVVDAKGEPTRQALQAAAWGEPVPKSEADERRLAAKGKQLLDRYHAVKDGAAGKSADGTGKRAAGGKVARASGTRSRSAPQKKAAAKKTAKRAAPATGTSRGTKTTSKGVRKPER